MLISPAANIDEQSLVFNQRLIKMRRLIKDTLEIFSGSGDITVRSFAIAQPLSLGGPIRLHIPRVVARRRDVIIDVN